MRAVLRRVLRLENRLQGVANPLRIRVFVQRADRRPSLVNATCQRSLHPNGTLLELVRLDRSDEGRKPIADEELDRWVETFPVRGVGRNDMRKYR